MTTILAEGQWLYSVDEKGRFFLPPKIRSLGETWILALNPISNVLTLFPLRTWQDKASKSKNPEQLRLKWRPFQIDLDGQGRLIIPPALRELGKIGRAITVISMGESLILRNNPVGKSHRRN